MHAAASAAKRSAAQSGGGCRGQCAAGRLPAGRTMPILDPGGAAMGHPVESSAVPGQQEVRFEPRRVEKPWGYELIWAHAERYVGKVLHVARGHATCRTFPT